MKNAIFLKNMIKFIRLVMNNLQKKSLFFAWQIKKMQYNWNMSHVEQVIYVQSDTN